MGDGLQCLRTKWQILSIPWEIGMSPLYGSCQETQNKVPQNMTSTDRAEGALVTSRTEGKTLNPGEVLKEVDNLYFMV